MGGQSLKPEQCKGVMSLIDTDSDGTIAYDEFVSFVSKSRSELDSIAQGIKKWLNARIESSDDDDDVHDVFKMYADASRSTKRKASKRGVQTKGGALIFRDGIESMVAAYQEESKARLTSGEFYSIMRAIDPLGKGFVDIDMLRAFLSDNRDASIVPGAQKRDGDDEVHQSPSSEGPTAIVDIKISVGTKMAAKLWNQGYERLPVNLNDGGFGALPMVWVKRASRANYESEEAFKRARITDIVFSRSKKDNALTAAGYSRVGTSTNAGAWFVRRQFLWVRRNKSETNYVCDIAVTSGKLRRKTSELWCPPYRGFKRTKGDCNRGNVGNAVFLWYWKNDYGEENERRQLEKAARSDPLKPLAKLVRQKLREMTESVDINVLWSKYDRKKRGWMGRAEIRRLLREMGIKVSGRRIAHVVSLLDINGDNRVEKDELEAFLAFNPAEVDQVADEVRRAIKKRCGSRARHSAHAMRKYLRRLFDDFETSGTGRLDKSSFARAIDSLGMRLTIRDLEQLIGRFDINGDGYIECKEFIDFVTSSERARDASYARIERAARKFRSWARKAGSEGNNDGDEEFNWQHAFHLMHAKAQSPRKSAKTGSHARPSQISGRHIGIFFRRKLSEKLTDEEIVTLLKRLGERDGVHLSFENFVRFARSETYVDSILNVVMDYIFEAAKRDGHKDLRAAFRVFDVNHDGSISKSEFKKALDSLHVDGMPIVVTDKELGLLVGRFDVDGDGSVDMDEFIEFARKEERVRKRSHAAAGKDIDPVVRALLVKLRKRVRVMAKRSVVNNVEQDDREAYRKVFDKFDVDGNGYFTVLGFERGLRKIRVISNSDRTPALSEGQIMQAFHRLDGLAKGQVDFQHFYEFATADKDDDADDDSNDGEEYTDDDFDGARKGYATFAEGKAALSKLRSLIEDHFGSDSEDGVGQQLVDMFANCDHDGAGSVSESDFARVLRRVGATRSSSSAVARLLRTKDGVQYNALCEFVAGSATASDVLGRMYDEGDEGKMKQRFGLCTIPELEILILTSARSIAFAVLFGKVS